MSDRHFHLKLEASYQGDKNEIDGLRVEVLNKDVWETLDLSIRSPGFLLFINGLFSCQHLYMRTNSAERGLLLDSSAGEMKVVAGEFWRIKEAYISFNVKLRSGIPKEDDLAYIRDRMTHCPVSTNLPDDIQINNAVNFDS